MTLVVILLIVVPIAELYLIVRVAELIGVLPTLALLLGSAILGALLLRQQGRGAWRRFNAALAARRFPGRELIDGLLIAPRRHPARDPGLHLRRPRHHPPRPTDASDRQEGVRAYLGRRLIVLGAADRTMRDAGRSARVSYDYDASAEELDSDERELPG